MGNDEDVQAIFAFETLCKSRNSTFMTVGEVGLKGDLQLATIESENGLQANSLQVNFDVIEVDSGESTGVNLESSVNIPEIVEAGLDITTRTLTLVLYNEFLLSSFNLTKLRI